MPSNVGSVVVPEAGCVEVVVDDVAEHRADVTGSALLGHLEEVQPRRLASRDLVGDVARSVPPELAWAVSSAERVALVDESWGPHRPAAGVHVVAVEPRARDLRLGLQGREQLLQLAVVEGGRRRRRARLHALSRRASGPDRERNHGPCWWAGTPLRTCWGATQGGHVIRPGTRCPPRVSWWRPDSGGHRVISTSRWLNEIKFTVSTVTPPGASAGTRRRALKRSTVSTTCHPITAPTGGPQLRLIQGHVAARSHAKIFRSLYRAREGSEARARLRTNTSYFIAAKSDSPWVANPRNAYAGLAVSIRRSLDARRAHRREFGTDAGRGPRLWTSPSSVLRIGLCDRCHGGRDRT